MIKIFIKKQHFFCLKNIFAEHSKMFLCSFTDNLCIFDVNICFFSQNIKIFIY